ncbi:MAG: flagellar motor protein MotB [Cytophagales bacterium]
MKSIKILTGILGFVIVFSSCVSSKKHNELLAKKLRLDADFSECQDSLNANKTLNKTKSEQIVNLYNIAKELMLDTTLKADNISRIQKLLEEQTATGDRLRKDYKDLLANYSAESNQMSSNLARKEQQLLDLEKSLMLTKSTNDKLLTDLKERESKLKDLQQIMAQKDSAVLALRNSVTDALLSFKDNGLTVNVKNGKVYVSLSEKLLFGSGSTSVDKKGEEALRKLGSVLKNQPEVNVMIEGHTDDVPVAKNTNAAFRDNWDLSVLRATDITRILIAEGVKPQKITPAGKAEFLPIVDGKSAEIRQKNRRTEIILTPKLDELFKILETQ